VAVLERLMAVDVNQERLAWRWRAPRTTASSIFESTRNDGLGVQLSTGDISNWN
jgi:hypothetical protein